MELPAAAQISTWKSVRPYPVFISFFLFGFDWCLRLQKVGYCKGDKRSGAGKVPWKEEDVRALAFELKAGLPLPVVQVLTSADWHGGKLTQLDELVKPSVEDIKLNFAWVAPFVKASPDKVPSGFMIADTFLMCDQFFMGKLLQPKEAGDTKQTLAAAEASNCKRLIGALRGLWRSSL